MEHGVDIAQTLRQLEAFTQQRVIKTENLYHPARPANTLADMRRQGFRRQTGRLRDTHIGRGIAATVQA